MAYGAILGQQTDLSPYANSVQLTTTGSSTYTLTLPDGTDVVSGVSEALGLPNTFTQMQIVSYVGTGTYGASNPCSITADFQIKLLFAVGYVQNVSHYALSEDLAQLFLVGDVLTTSFKQFSGFSTSRNNLNSSYGKKSNDGKTFYWFNESDDNQLNRPSAKYYFIAFG